jgi:hypothetical protein
VSNRAAVFRLAMRSSVSAPMTVSSVRRGFYHNTAIPGEIIFEQLP